jgi:uncharacterized membrane protein
MKRPVSGEHVGARELRMIRRPQQLVVHYLFELGVLLKFINGAIEVIGGVFLLFITPQSLNRLAAKLLTNELLEDPDDLVANTIMHAVQELSANARVFASAYLLVHGIVKVGLVIALWKRKMWAYPLAGVVLVLFTVYQVYLFSHSRSPFQLVLTVMDVVILLLLWSEYRRVAHPQDKELH